MSNWEKVKLRHLGISTPNQLQAQTPSNPQGSHRGSSGSYVTMFIGT